MAEGIVEVLTGLHAEGVVDSYGMGREEDRWTGGFMIGDKLYSLQEQHERGLFRVANMAVPLGEMREFIRELKAKREGKISDED